MGFSLQYTTVESLTGKFLLAQPVLVDPNFAKSVVLIVRHDQEGAFGLVINKPLTVNIEQALGDTVESAQGNDAPVYSGGPCQGPVFAMHADPTIGGEEPIAGVYLTTERDAINLLLFSNAEPVKLFASYSGWSPGQIESELAEGSWSIVQGDAGEAFSVDPHLWSRLHTRISLSRYVDPEHIPDDPTVN